jgi:5-methylcytosine-specific restriction endonuclease McrA
MEIENYLMQFENKISFEKYLEYEFERVNNKKNKFLTGTDWVEIIKEQELKCFYCQTHLEIIQELIFEGIINPRKRGKHAYSGMHFELDHKNANKKDNAKNNLVASCYYCNNDKSNTFTSEIFRDYFGENKSNSFKKLFDDKNLYSISLLRHNFERKTD